MNPVKYEEILPPMDQEEIKAKSAELAVFYAAKADGKKLQIFTEELWRQVDDRNAPSLRSNLSRWRIEPEPRRKWETLSGVTTSDKHTADAWKAKAYPVTEWVEVLP